MVAHLLLLSTLLVPPPQSGSPAMRPHRVGLGGSLSVSNHGLGGSMRYWFGDRVGVDVASFWVRSRDYTTYTTTNLSTTTSSTITTPSTFLLTPSFLVMLAPSHPQQDFDLRPYVGGGMNYTRSGAYQYSNVTTLGAARSGAGMQAFGGVEMTFKDMPNAAFSVEVAYYHFATNVATTSSVRSGTDMYFTLHYYFK